MFSPASPVLRAANRATLVGSQITGCRKHDSTASRQRRQSDRQQGAMMDGKDHAGSPSRSSMTGARRTRQASKHIRSQTSLRQVYRKRRCPASDKGMIDSGPHGPEFRRRSRRCPCQRRAAMSPPSDHMAAARAKTSTPCRTGSGGCRHLASRSGSTICVAVSLRAASSVA
jgi:hypothetical protein